MIQLHRDSIQLGVHVDSLPQWLPPARGDGYWHIPRSACRHEDGSLYVNYWCGPGRRFAADPIEVPAPLELRCGTCVGRNLGYRREDGLIFRPRDEWKLPAWCPGDDWIEGTRNCFACGRQTNAAGGWSRWGIARHRPAPELLQFHEPCPLHGWRWMHTREQRLVCTMWRCTHTSARSATLPAS